jgi:hypothetical protein
MATAATIDQMALSHPAGISGVALRISTRGNPEHRTFSK